MCARSLLNNEETIFFCFVCHIVGKGKERERETERKQKKTTTTTTNCRCHFLLTTSVVALSLVFFFIKLISATVVAVIYWLHGQYFVVVFFFRSCRLVCRCTNKKKTNTATRPPNACIWCNHFFVVVFVLFASVFIQTNKLTKVSKERKSNCNKRERERDYTKTTNMIACEHALSLSLSRNNERERVSFIKAHCTLHN